jgi:hypothetical protein
MRKLIFMSKDTKKKVKELVQLAGKRGALALLIKEGLSASTADKLIRDRYPSEAKELIRMAIARAIQAAGQAKAS